MSLLPKIDFLRLEAASYHPHIICLTETWLSSSMPDSEIAITGFKVYRLDRNRQGGGVLIYVSNNLQSQLLKVDTFNLELIWIKIVADSLSLKLGVFYRPPSSPVGSIDSLECSLEDINPIDFNNVVLVGDFNINFSYGSSSPLKSRLHQLMYKFNLMQVVNQATHISPNGKSSLIDLALIGNSDRCAKCEILPPVSSSDHYIVKLALKMQLPSTRPKKETRILWQYHQADFVFARHLINRTYWDFLITDEVETSWVQWKSAFLDIMKTAIPHKQVTIRRNLPWIKLHIIEMMKKRDHLFKKARRSGSPAMWSKYRSIRNRVIQQLRSAKFAFFSNINQADPKSFWSLFSLHKPI